MLSWPTFYSHIVVLVSILHITTATRDLHSRRHSQTREDGGTYDTLSLDEIARRYTRRTAGGVHLPIIKREVPVSLRRRAQTAGIGLGDYYDVAYSVLLTVGDVTAPLILDTGSSDLWIMSDACTSGCRSNKVPLYPQASFQPSGLDVALFYGDSTSGTNAFGMIGTDTVDLAGLKLNDQYFAAINKTNTTISLTGSSGIFGLGFPSNSVLWNKVLARELQASRGISSRDAVDTREAPEFHQPHHDVKYGTHNFPDLSHFHSRFPPSLPSIVDPTLPPGEHKHGRRQRTSTAMTTVLSSFSTLGPFLTRLVVNSDLTLPMFAVTMQRNTIDVGGTGMLSIGELPSGYSLDSLTWVPVRGYSSSEGGLPGPPDSPSETYPIAWEVMIDDVYLDGVKLPRSNLSSQTIQLSALIDTGNSLIRGPEDVVEQIYSTLASERIGTALNGRFLCSQPHTLAFSIGGELFPVDPRDFASQVFEDDVTICAPNLVPTDPPSPGGYLFSWSLGVPFLKSVLSAYYYGNVTYPSQDQPRIGFLSTVPPDADELMKAAVTNAARIDQNFPMVSSPAPTGVPSSNERPANPVDDSKNSSEMILPTLWIFAIVLLSSFYLSWV